MKQKQTKKRILGIDPGFGRMGWGVIEGRKDQWQYIAHGCIETDKKKSFVERLEILYAELSDVIKVYAPAHSAVEDLYFNKNVTTAVQVAQARGVILLTLSQAGLGISEVTPLQVKQAVTGYGRADKGQVQKMVQMLLCLKEKPKQDDAVDALAVALTCAASLHLVHL
jgi:crossover junction endodeoxyribonuclease RuvC